MVKYTTLEHINQAIAELEAAEKTALNEEDTEFNLSELSRVLYYLRALANMLES